MEARQRKPTTPQEASHSHENGKTPSFIARFEWKKWIQNVVFMLLALLLIRYYYYYESIPEVEVIARVNVPHEQMTFFAIPCSDDYQNESFKECVPKKCGRVVIDNLVTEEEAKLLLRLVKDGLSFGGSNGGASILDLHSGALSKGEAFINIFETTKTKNIQLFSEEDFEAYKNVKNKILSTVSTSFGIPANKLFLTKPTFFSRMTNKRAKTVHDEYWHPHIDKVTYGSFHYTALLYLSNYGHDFTGGRFFFIDPDRNRTLEPRFGRVSMFTSGSENVHFVEKVKTGTRFALTVAFTCDPSQAIANPTLS